MNQRFERHQATLASSEAWPACADASAIGRGTPSGQVPPSGQFSENHRKARSLRFRVGDE